MKIHNIIKQKRLELGLTIKELAQKVNVSEASISRWERGNVVNMKVDGITRLAHALDIPPHVLTGYKEGAAFEDQPQVRTREEMNAVVEAVRIELLRQGVDIYKKKGQYRVQNDIAVAEISEGEIVDYIEEGMQLIKYRLDRYLYDNMPLKEKKAGARQNKTQPFQETEPLFEEDE